MQKVTWLSEFCHMLKVREFLAKAPAILQFYDTEEVKKKMFQNKGLFFIFA